MKNYIKIGCESAGVSGMAAEALLAAAAGILADERLKPAELCAELCNILGKNSEFWQDYFASTANFVK